MTQTIEVHEDGVALAFSFEEMLRYSGPGSPAGVALGFKLLERALPLLDPDRPVERREVAITTAFRGPGARDACELVTRGLTDGRYVIDLGMERPERGRTLESFAFQAGYRGRSLSLVLREGNVTDEFVALAQQDHRTQAEEEHFTNLKQQAAVLLMSRPAAEVFDVE